MKTKLFLFRVILLIAVSIHFLSMPIKSADAEEGKIIRIEAGEEGTPPSLKADPVELTIRKNIIVIWLNTIKDDEVNIRFADGKTIGEATKDRMGFNLEKNGGYEARYLPSIGTASLRFVKEGTYMYTIQSQRRTSPATGKIIVR